MFGSNLFASALFGGIDIYSILINVSEPIVNVFEGDSIADQSVVTEQSDIAPLPIDPNVNDSSTTSESIKLNLLSHPSVFDATTITDVPGFYPDLVIVTEKITMLVLSQGQVFDATTTSESTLMELNPVDLDVIDSSSTSESTVLEVPETNQVFDATSVTEFVNTILVDETSVFDTSTLSEFINLNIVQDITIFDPINTAENVNLVLSTSNAVFDLVGTSEFVRIVYPINEGLLIHINTYDD